LTHFLFIRANVNLETREEHATTTSPTPTPTTPPGVVLAMLRFVFFLVVFLIEGRGKHRALFAANAPAFVQSSSSSSRWKE
jgi:hypothetical protein